MSVEQTMSDAAGMEGEPETGMRPAPKAEVVLGLCRAVLRGEFEPGKRLVEMDLAERFGVSRTPVREALLELEGLGIVELRRNCGAVLGPFGPREVREIYGVRAILEVEATRLAAGKIDAGVLESLREGFAKLCEGEAVDDEWLLDRSLHQAIAEASGNRRLAGEIGRYGSLVQAVREVVLSQLEEVHAHTLKQHVEIVEALVKEDAEGAARAMQAHLERAAESAVIALEKIRS